MWKCPKCETLNDETVGLCFICNEPKQLYQPTAPMRRPKPDVHAPVSGESNNGWIIGLAIGVSIFITLIFLIALL